MTGDLDWTAEGAPRSRRFGDVYFSPADGLAESRAVFLAGCGLPGAWRGRERFTVGELGFGTGLNVLALLELWRRERPAGARLHVFSVEGFPLTPADARRALEAWPELVEFAAPLLARWPQARGVTRVDWPDLGATLDVQVGEAGTALAGWDGRADAWFLDGFAPSRNPEMWRDEVLALVAARSSPGARLATFTVAGAVRRGLEAQGFAVERRPGHGRKRERSEARLERPPATRASRGWAARPPTADGPVAVIGGGIAAASLVRALRALGREAVVVAGPERNASGAPAALVEPRLDLGDGPAARLYAQAFRRAVDLYETEAADAVIARGVRKLGTFADAERFARLVASPLFAPGALETETGDSLALALGEPHDGPALRILLGLSVDAARIVEAWLAPACRVEGVVADFRRDGDVWRLIDGAGRVMASAPVVVTAAGAGSVRLLPEAPIEPVRGQLSFAPGVPGPAASWGGYAAPARGGLVFGATHDRGDAGLDLRPADHARNLSSLARALPMLAAALDPATLQGRAAVRAATPDRLPLAGPVVDSEAFENVWGALAYGREPESADLCLRPGLFVLGGLGSRGFTTAPLLAEHLAAWITGAPSPLPLDLAAAVHPGRFLVRTLRRSHRGG